MQVIEGAEEKIKQLITNIRNDHRNRDVQIITDGDVKSRIFEGWFMGFLLMSFHDFLQIEGIRDIKTKEDFLPFISKPGKALEFLQSFYSSNIQPTQFK